MIIQCEACNAKYRLDDSKIKEGGVKVRCTKCQNVFVVMPPPPPEEKVSPNIEKAPEAPSVKIPEPTPKKEEEIPPKKEEKKIEPPQWGMEFTFEEKPKEEEKKPSWDIGLPPTKEEAPKPEEEKKELEFKIGEESIFEEEKKEAAPAKPSRFGFEEEFAPPAEKPSFEIEAPPKEEEFVISQKEEAKPPAMEAVKITPPPLEMPSEGPAAREFEETKEVWFEAPAEKKSAIPRIITIIIILLLLAGAGLILKGGTEFLKGIIGTGEAPQKTMDFMDLKGYYVNNSAAGALFVIEGKIINNLDTPKRVGGIHNILFGKNGNRVADRWVAPGRVISQDELRTISTDELEKRFKDREGEIPARGMVPFMAVFYNIPGELSEFSVEINQ